MPQSRGSPPWSDLPPELLGLVFLRLPTRADRAFFPAVCRTWCSAARQIRLPLPAPVPWLVLPGGSVTSFPGGETFQLPFGARYHTSCGEWLLLSVDDVICYLMNPFTRATIPLPYYEQPVEFGDDMEEEVDGPGTWLEEMVNGEISVLSLVVCSTRLIAAIVAVGELGAIALCRPGAATWSVSAREGCRWFSHMVFFQEKLYALDNIADLEDLIAIDFVDEDDSDKPRVSRIERIIEGISVPHPTYSACMHYLLQSHGSLLMICRKLSYTVEHGLGVPGSSEFEVFKADFEQHSWAEARTLGSDQALFLGQGCSRAVRVSPSDLSRDCIFFLDDYTSCYWKKTTTSSGVYDMKDKKVYSPLPMVSWKSRDVPATWIFWQGDLETAREN